MHYGDMGSGHWIMMVVAALPWMGFMALIGAMAWAAIRFRRESATPLDLLKETYARGQITRSVRADETRPGVSRQSDDCHERSAQWLR